MNLRMQPLVLVSTVLLVPEPEPGVKQVTNAGQYTEDGQIWVEVFGIQ